MKSANGGTARIAKAMENPWLFLTPIKPRLERRQMEAFEAFMHDLMVTMVHEASHAVAMELAGQRVGSIRLYPSGRAGQLGVTLPEVRKGQSRRTFIDEMEDQVGPHGLAREVVTRFIGPLAEYRHRPGRVMGGWEDDRSSAAKVLIYLDDNHGASADLLWSEAWREACRMVLDARIWAAVSAIAEDFEARPFSLVQRPVHVMSGNKVRTILARHLPDGWRWTGAFAPTSKLWRTYRRS